MNSVAVNFFFTSLLVNAFLMGKHLGAELLVI